MGALPYCRSGPRWPGPVFPRKRAGSQTGRTGSAGDRLQIGKACDLKTVMATPLPRIITTPGWVSRPLKLAGPMASGVALAAPAHGFHAPHGRGPDPAPFGLLHMKSNGYTAPGRGNAKLDRNAKSCLFLPENTLRQRALARSPWVLSRNCRFGADAAAIAQMGAWRRAGHRA